MGWNGSGTFQRLYSWVADKAAGLDISSTRMDADTNDIATNGFGNCLTRDGQGQPTANLPMANFRHTGVGNGSDRTDYAAMGQLQDGTINWTTAVGTNTITATFTPVPTVLNDGQLCFIRAAAANTSTTPTFSPNGLQAHTIQRYGGAALAIGDIAAAGYECVLRYNQPIGKWELLNPANPINNATIGGTSALTIPTGLTAQRPGSPAVAQMRFNSQTSAFEGYDGAGWRNFHSPAGATPNVQSFTSGAGTYNTPSGALYLIVEMVGGGGGGGGSGPSAGAATAGSTTTFNSVNASGGAQGTSATVSNGQAGGGGGTAGTGSASVRFPGQAGDPGNNGITAIGGKGGSSVFGGGGGWGTASINAGAAQSNTGSGGGGGGATATPTGGGGGGGAGEYARLFIPNPSATYSYSVGSGGTGAAGGGGTNGANGAAGVIIVTAYYQ